MKIEKDIRVHSRIFAVTIDNLHSIFRQLKETQWLPDEQGNYHKPDKLFAPTSENRKALGDSVAYLHPDFDVTDKQKNEPARWLADKLGIHSSADTESVMDYLRSLSKNNADVDIKTLEAIYRFLHERGALRKGEFEEEPLLFSSTSETHWWRAGEVFWEDESPVFGTLRGYLKEHYSERLKPFFISVG